MAILRIQPGRDIRKTWLALACGLCLAPLAYAQTRAIQAPPSTMDGASAQSAAPKIAVASADDESFEINDSNSIEALIQQIAQRQQQLQTDTERLPEVKESLVKLYEQARIDLEAALKAQQKRTERTESVHAAPASLEAAKARKEEEGGKQVADSESSQFMSFDEVESRRRALEAELATAMNERVALSEKIARREKRRKELPQLISDAKAKLDQIGNPPSNGNPDDPLVREASGWAVESARQLLSEQLQGFEAEQRQYEAEGMLLPLQLELAQNAEKRLQDRVRIVNEQLDRIRTDRILAKYSEAKKLVSDAPEDLKPAGQQLLKRIEAWMELAANQARIKAELDTARKLLARWSDRRTQMNSRVDPQPRQDGVSDFISGFNSWIGLMLRKQRAELPDPKQLEARIREYQSEMQQTDSLLFDLEDALIENKQRQENLEYDLTRDDVADETDSPAARAAALLRHNAEVIQTIKFDANAYLADLYDIADVRDSTIQLTHQYRDFIDRHVLWIRSMERLNRADWHSGVEAFRWLVDYNNWRATGYLLMRDATEQFALYILFAIGGVVAVANQARLRRLVSQYSAKAEKNNCTDFRWTARSLMLTILISLPVPLGLFFVYWRITTAVSSASVPPADIEFATGLAQGLLLATALFLPLELLRQLCRFGGLGIKHFGWQEQSARRLATNLRWLIDFTIPLAIVVGLFLTQSNQRWESSFGRAAFIVLMPLLSFFLARIFAPQSGIVHHFLETHSGGWLDRLSVVWYPILVLLPIALAMVSFIGYHYTAQRLAFHMVSTLWMIVALTIAYCVMMRWLVLNRRRLMLAQARQRLEEASRREPPSSESLVSVEEPRIDLVAINEQTKRLVTSLVVATGFVLAYLIWSDVLPAVSMLDRFELWTVEGSVAGETVKITWANLLLVIPIVVLVIIAGRNVPGLLEIAFLQHLPLTSAARYAITTLSRYAIFAMGIVVVTSMIGLRWSSVQWLVAALGVGLGFGLQEIFANFVSGIILLFEQPIRVGDIVSLDGTTGSVTKIRMRATTIVNWDRQELIVPNKDLITGKLINWTLSDSTNRITVNVGVTYGCDTRRACELIMEVCDEHSNVLREPRPSVTFEGFGDNSLNLVLRAFLDSLENRLTTIHELHQRIYDAFNDAGLEIAFPQRDIHIRSLPEGWNRWLESRATFQND